MAAVDEFEFTQNDTPPSDRPGRRSWSRHPAVWIVAACALIGIGAVAAEPQPGLLIEDVDGADLGLLELDLAQAPEVAWESETDVSGFQQVTDEVVIVHLLDGTLGGVDLDTGESLWTVPDAHLCHSSEHGVVCVEEPGLADAVVVEIDAVTGAVTSAASQEHWRRSSSTTASS